MTLTEFLLARIADDEAMALHSRGIGGSGWAPGSGGIYWSDSASGELHIDPARVLAECEAKRRIVEGMVSAESDASYGDERFGGLADGYAYAVAHLAAIYDSHPDYREEWKP